MTTGERMKTRRKELGISAESVAHAINLSPATVYRYENGDIDKVPGDLLAPIAKALKTTPAFLMGWEDSPSAEPEITFDDFTYAMYNEGKELTAAQKETLLEMARLFRRQLDKEKQGEK